MADLEIHAVHRPDDATGYAFRLARTIKRDPAGARVEFRPVVVAPGGPARSLPSGATVLLLVGPRWLSATPPDADDALFRLVSGALSDGSRIVPVLFRVPLSGWSALCAQVPDPLGAALAALNAVGLRSESFDADVHALLGRLAAPRDALWADRPARTLIEVVAERGKLLKWYANRDKTLRVQIDDREVGALSAYADRVVCEVPPGAHRVRIGQGTLNPRSPALTVAVRAGATVTIRCGRNIFTGGLTLEEG